MRLETVATRDKLLLLFLCAGIIAWSFLEATFWWVAPDISISVAYVYLPKYWKRYLLLALLGALAGSILTYLWAAHFPEAWLQYVSSMRFHSGKNIQYVKAALLSNLLNIIKGAWGGIPFKLYFGLAHMQGVSLIKLAPLGLISRSIRFTFVLGVTHLIKHFSKPWSIRHPTQFSVILLIIWASMIRLFDVLINRVFV